MKGNKIMKKLQIQSKTTMAALLIAITLSACSSAAPIAATHLAATTRSDPPTYEGSLPSNQPWYANTR
jgi:hypothetical protein